MAIPIKTEDEISLMRESGKILAEVLQKTCDLAKPGISTWELDQFAENFIREKGGLPTFKGYQGFPGTLCVSRNDEIVHGIPRKETILREGDLLTIDCGVTLQGLITDAARSIGIGKIDQEKEKLIRLAYQALSSAIDKIKPGIHLSEISKTIQRVVESQGYHIINDLTGHGVGRKLHEEPTILNYFDGNPGPILRSGMTLAIEPIFSVGTHHMKQLSDGWTLVTHDGSTAVQVENTVLITENGVEILTEI